MARARRTFQIWLQSTLWPRSRAWMNESPMAMPISAPIVQCDDEFGIPNHHVNRFQASAVPNRATSIGTAGLPLGGVSTSGGRSSTSA